MPLTPLRLSPVVWWAALVLVVLPPMATAQTASLHGTVRDAITDDPLPGANVVVAAPGTRTGTATDTAGRFEVRGLPAGTYTVTVSFVGFETRTLEALTLTAGEARDVAIALRPSDLQINPVTVTASLGAPEKLLDAPSSIFVLRRRRDRNPHRAQRCRTSEDYVPSVDLISTGINQSRVVIRGFNDNLASSLLTLVDNRIARIPSIRLTALQLIPIGTGDIERIEVVSGPASALYGPNSANGVVHILTKSPFDARGTTVGLSVGQNDIVSGAATHAGTIGSRKLGFKISGQYYEGE